MANWFALGVFVAATVVLIALASRRQRRHGGTRRPEFGKGKRGLNEKAPDDWWFDP